MKLAEAVDPTSSWSVRVNTARGAVFRRRGLRYQFLAVFVRNCTRATFPAAVYGTQRVGGSVLTSIPRCRELVPRVGSGYMVNFPVVGLSCPSLSSAELLNQTMWFLSAIIL